MMVPHVEAVFNPLNVCSILLNLKIENREGKTQIYYIAL